VPCPAVISFSGGRTSSYMLKKIVDAYGGRLPDTVAVVFANTGMEREETLQFVDVCGREWGIDIVWVEYLWDAPHRTRVVDFATASRNGEPYAALIDRKGFVPCVNLRFCSSFLKRDRIESYARHRLGLKRWHSVIGLRADEQRRVLRMRAMNCGSRTGAHAVLPLADAGVRQADVLDWWKRQPFDLGIPSYAGNCTLCMLKGRAKLIRLIRKNPSLADWWIEQEAKVAHRTGPDGRASESMKRFRLGETYAELKAAALAHRDLFDEGPPAGDGSAGSDSFDCHCTD
jgi:3'-phosphoadenosine 5'-phosphosulfate sulfotransferase (PAPS reductase)/FAD synthetase